MTRLTLRLLTLMLCAPIAAGAEAPDSGTDPVLASLVRETLEKNPEYARARAELTAERERIPQVGALADPTLTLGIQNDGFKRIEIGNMGTSFWQVMVTQPLPWPGKRGLREEVARSTASATEVGLERIRLTTTAEVERAYLDLLLVRGKLELLGKLDVLWREAEAVARARYEVGAVTQSDVVRAQLERTRLMLQRLALEASGQARLQALNRLRVRPLDEPIETTRRLSDVGDPSLPTVAEATADAEAHSPDLAQARRSVVTAERRVDLARRERYPDFTVSAAIMPRGGLEPMWSANVGISLPIWAGRKQSRAVDENVSRRDAETQGEEAIRQVLRLRTQERLTVLDALLRTIRLYREGLLIQSETAVRSTVTQYKVGKVPFASVLEVMRGLVADEGAYLDAIAQAQRVAISQRELNLQPTPGLGGGGATAMSGGTVPGSSGMTASARPSSGAAPAAPSQAAGSSSGM
jgi:cobalt-zinc-cadmium efflux system outer membrane protein